MMQNSELYHYGVPGMKWGVRRYQNEDGTLTPAGRARLKKAKKKFTKHSSRAIKRLGNSNTATRLYVEAYNKSIPEANAELQKYNDEWDRKHGTAPLDSTNQEEYEQGWYAKESEIVEKYYKYEIRQFMLSDKDIQAAKRIIDKYGMAHYDEETESFMDAYNSAVNYRMQ